MECNNEILWDFSPLSQLSRKNYTTQEISTLLTNFLSQLKDNKEATVNPRYENEATKSNLLNFEKSRQLMTHVIFLFSFRATYFVTHSIEWTDEKIYLCKQKRHCMCIIRFQQGYLFPENYLSDHTNSIILYQTAGRQLLPSVFNTSL